MIRRAAAGKAHSEKEKEQTMPGDVVAGSILAGQVGFMSLEDQGLEATPVAPSKEAPAQQ